MRTLVRNELPIFASFFFSALGNGGNNIARPLFSASFGVSFFFIALVSITGPIANLFGAPLAGILSDRMGRRPVIMSGLFIRAISSFLEMFAQSYEQFIALEFMGSIGLAIWITGANIVVADVSGENNRGRAVALRTSSQKLGNLIGPLIAGPMGAIWGLRSIFLLNALGKMIALAIYFMMIRESRPASAEAESRSRPLLPKRSELKAFTTVPVMAVLFAVIIIQLIAGGGSFEALFPKHVQDNAGMDTIAIGYMLFATGLATFLVALPNGVFVDKFGRKISMLPGMALLAVGCVMLSGANDFWSVLIGVVVLGLGSGICLGASQVIAMDLAPEATRGQFLGVWQFFMSAGGIFVPLIVGVLGTMLGTGGAFVVIAVLVVIAMPIYGIFGPEPKRE